MHFDLSRFELLNVENVVQQLEQMFPRAPDVAQVVVLTLVELAKHALQEHFRKADDGVQRCTQLVGHTGQEFRLVPARDFECGALLLQLPVQLRVDQGQCGLAGERLQQVADLLRDVSGCMAANNQRTNDAAFAKRTLPLAGPPEKGQPPHGSRQRGPMPRTICRTELNQKSSR